MKAILFDFGGTIDTNGVHWSEKYWDLYARFSPGVAKSEFERAFVCSEEVILADRTIARATMRETIRRQIAAQFDFLGLDRNDKLYIRMAETLYTDLTEVVGRARTILEGLGKRFRLGLVSNFYGNLDIVCAEFGIGQYFSAMIDSAVVGVRKPDPEIFRRALEAIGNRPEESFVVGDSYDRDIVPAKQLGCRTIWLRGKSWIKPAATDAADYTINSLTQLNDIVHRIT